MRVRRLGTDLTSAQKEMKAKHKAYENAVGILSRRLQEALTEKETTEAELSKLKAQVSDGGNDKALQVNYKVHILSCIAAKSKQKGKCFLWTFRRRLKLSRLS